MLTVPKYYNNINVPPGYKTLRNHHAVGYQTLLDAFDVLYKLPSLLMSSFRCCEVSIVTD